MHQTMETEFSRHCVHPYNIQDTAHIVFIHITAVAKSGNIFMARKRVSKSSLMTELCFYNFVYFDSFSKYVFGFHHKQCASD